jgi:DNA-binding MarR family transcriptional regulator
MKTSELTRNIWLWLMNREGYWTAAEIARGIGEETMDVFNRLMRMDRDNLVKKAKGEQSRRLVYGVDGTCLVPCGLALAEVQAA